MAESKPNSAHVTVVCPVAHCTRRKLGSVPSWAAPSLPLEEKILPAFATYYTGPRPVCQFGTSWIPARFKQVPVLLQEERLVLTTTTTPGIPSFWVESLYPSQMQKWTVSLGVATTPCAGQLGDFAPLPQWSGLAPGKCMCVWKQKQVQAVPCRCLLCPYPLCSSSDLCVLFTGATRASCT